MCMFQRLSHSRQQSRFSASSLNINCIPHTIIETDASCKIIPESGAREAAQQISFAPLSHLPCLLVQGHFFSQLPALLIELGNIKIKLMDLTLVLMAEKDIAKSLSLCRVGLAEVKSIKLSSCQDHQIILFRFCTLEVHSTRIYTLKILDFHISKERTNPISHGIAGYLLWNNLLNWLTLFLCSLQNQGGKLINIYNININQAKELCSLCLNS